MTPSEEYSGRVQYEMIELILSEKLFGLFCELLATILCRLGITPERFIKVMLQDDTIDASIIEFLADNIIDREVRNAA